MPRLPISSPRAALLTISPNGVTRFWSGILVLRRHGATCANAGCPTSFVALLKAPIHNHDEAAPAGA
jgi:hypothetical protein